ncbi:MAG: sigma factor-like helix-turn-helix DNA-binding protein [Lachnospirales bacterium]|jgi:DNA-directed RNA polymerase specialized sigma subunit
MKNTRISITDKNKDLVEYDNYLKNISATNDYTISQMTEALSKAMSYLSLSDKKILYLYFYKALTQNEIATLENISKQAICLRLKKIILKIQDMIKMLRIDISELGLSEREEKIFKLYYIKKIKIKTISTLLNISKSTVVNDLRKIKYKINYTESSNTL